MLDAHNHDCLHADVYHNVYRVFMDCFSWYIQHTSQSFESRFECRQVGAVSSLFVWEREFQVTPGLVLGPSEVETGGRHQRQLRDGVLVVEQVSKVAGCLALWVWTLNWIRWDQDRTGVMWSWQGEQTCRVYLVQLIVKLPELAYLTLYTAIDPSLTGLTAVYSDAGCSQ